MQNTTISQFSDELNKLKLNLPIEVIIQNQFRDYIADHNNQILDDEEPDWANADALITNLVDEVHDGGYYPNDPTPRNECDYQITEEELELFLKQYFPTYNFG